MAKLDQKFHKNAKAKSKLDFGDDSQDYIQDDRKKKRRIVKVRYDSSEHSEFDY